MCILHFARKENNAFFSFPLMLICEQNEYSSFMHDVYIISLTLFIVQKYEIMNKSFAFLEFSDFDLRNILIN